MSLELIATAAFGLEAVVGRELRALGYEDQSIADGHVTFAADEAAVARTNIQLRSADRVLIKVGEFAATDFGQLFDRTRDLPWEAWLPKDAEFPVRGRSIRSQLHSVPDCQAIVKKAIVERLRPVHGIDWFEERGPLCGIEVALRKDRVLLTIDTTGPGLHKRGYRTLTGDAPLKETLAAGLLQLTFWNAERPFLDPFCGTGTIPIEAALLARRIAPGLRRTFAAENWPRLSKRPWAEARAEATDLALPPLETPLIATDIDDEALSKARLHAKQAGVEADIHFQRRSLAEISSKRRFGCVVCNPPYAERLGDRDEVETLYREMGRTFASLETWSFYVLTAHPQFERLFGRTADRRRKLYNGPLACQYFQFHGPRPPRESDRRDVPDAAEST